MSEPVAPKAEKLPSTLTANATHVSWKAKIAIAACSLLLFYAAVGTVVRSVRPIQLERGIASLGRANAQHFNSQAYQQLDRETRRYAQLMYRVVVVSSAIALAHPFLAGWLLRRRWAVKRYALWIALAGLGWGTLLSATCYHGLQRLAWFVEPGDVARYPDGRLLGVVLLGFCLVYSMLVGAIARTSFHGDRNP